MTKKAPPKKAKPAAKPASPRARRAKAQPPPIDLAEELQLPERVQGGYLPINVVLKYQAFVNEYLASGNATEASVKAGFVASTENAQKTMGSRLLDNEDVRGMLAITYRELMLKTQATPDRVWGELVRIAFADIGEAYGEDGDPLPMKDIPEDTRRAITGYKHVEKTFGEDGGSTEKEVKFGGKDAALDKLMKLHGMVKENSLTIVSGDELLQAIEAGRERAAKR